jgi:hypothetical protein
VVSSITRSTASGSTADFGVPFPYLDRTHVQVRLNGVLKTLGVDYSFTTDSLIHMSGNPAAGVIVERKRVTPTDPLTNFTPGNLDTGDLNVGILQPLYVAQEGNDSAADILLRAWFTTNFGNGGTITVGPDGTILIFDASGNIVPGPSASDIAGYATAAAASAAAAAASATASSGSATAASGSATLAGKWASNPEDNPVTTGPNLYSALHWAAKALASSVSAAATLAAAGLPGSPVANSFLQRNAGNTAYAPLTAVDTRLAIGARTYVATRTALKALDTTKDIVVFLSEAGREGEFVWRTGDFSAQVTADTSEAIYVKATAIASTAGAWVRAKGQPIDLKWCGAKCDATGIGTGTDDTTAVDAWVALLKFTKSDGYLPGPTRYNPSTGVWDLTGANHGMTIMGASKNNAGLWLDTGKQLKIQGANNFYNHLINLKVIGNVSGPVLTIGKDDFSDAFNGCDLLITVNNNSVNAASEGLRLNYVLASRIFATLNCGGTGRLGAGQGSAMVLRQACFNEFTVACGQALNAVYITSGFNFGNVFKANDYEEVGTDIKIDTANAANNVWLGGTIVGLTIFDCSAGHNNIVMGANIAPYGGGVLGTNRTGITVDDGVTRSVAQKIAPPATIAQFTLDSATTAIRSQFTMSRATVSKYDLFLNGDATGDIFEYATDDVPTGHQVRQIVRATGDQIVNQKLTLNNPTAGLGYSAGAGGAVAQATSKATGVALSKVCGQITMNAAALAAGTIVSFVATNTAVAATDVVVVNHISGGTLGAYTVNARCSAGAITFDVRNNTGGSLSEAVVIQYALVKAVNA